MMRTLKLITLMVVLLLSLTQCTKGGGKKNSDGSGAVAQPPSEVPAEKKERKAPKSSAGIQVGDMAPDFALMNVDGETVSLSGMADAQGYIVIFTCNHCPYSVAYEDRIIELHNTYAPQGFPVVAINPNDPDKVPEDSFEAMQVRASEKGFPFPYLFDDGQKVFPQYGATRTPHVFLLDKDLTVRYIGAIDDNHTDATAVQNAYLANAIKAVINGQAADPDFTKAVGCSIKVKS